MFSALPEGKFVREFYLPLLSETHTQVIVSFDHAGNLLISVAGEGIIHVFDVSNGSVDDDSVDDSPSQIISFGKVGSKDWLVELQSICVAQDGRVYAADHWGIHAFVY